MTAEISNRDDVIDSRDVIARMEELQADRDSCEQDDAGDANRFSEWDDANGHEFAALKTFAEEAEEYTPDWSYGATLIRDSYFVDYCEELVKDIGDLPKNIPDYLAIDWEATAENLKVDYTPVKFDGVTYWVR